MRFSFGVIRCVWEDGFGVREVDDSEIYIIRFLFLSLRALHLLVLDPEPLRLLALFDFSSPFLGIVVRRSKKE